VAAEAFAAGLIELNRSQAQAQAQAQAAVGAATSATAHAAAYAAESAVADIPEAQSAVIADHDFLEREAEAGNWTDITPVPAQPFAEMWPNGAPGWAT